MKVTNTLIISLILLTFNYSSIAHAITSAPKYTKIDAANYEKKMQLEIEHWKKRVGKRPDSVLFQVKLGLVLYSQAVFKGDLFQVDIAIGYIDRAIESLEKRGSTDKLAQLLLSKAIMQTTLHHFQSALKNVKRAEKLSEHAPPDQLMAELNWNMGNHTRAEQIIRATARERPSMKNYSRLAILEYSLGNYSQGETAFDQAKQHDTRVNPVTSSWLDVQMGIVNLKLRRYQTAKRHFFDALDITPTYVLAMEHLAESYKKLNEIPQAIALYEKAIGLSQNPEFKTALAQLYQQTGQSEKAAMLINDAEQQFEVLLNRYPQATYQQAAGFYLTRGKYKRAVAILQKNLQLRPNSESYLALSKAQRLASYTAAAKKSLVAAVNMPPVSLELCEMAEALNLDEAWVRATKPQCFDELAR